MNGPAWCFNGIFGPESAATLLGNRKVLPLDTSADGHVAIPASKLLDGFENELKGPLVFKITGLK